MNSSPVKTGPEERKSEGWLYWLAFLIALGFRTIQLGASPLTDSEATLALQALHLAQGKSPLLGPQPGYILLTSILFSVINSTNFMARVVPAMAGSVLVFAPWSFRDRIKPRPAIILAFLFAIDPGLVAFSRQASGTILAVTFLLFAWAMWRHGRLIPAGIFAGFALLSGPSLWAGLLTLGLTWLFFQGTHTRAAPEETPDQPPTSNSPITNSPITNFPTTNFPTTNFPITNSQLPISQYRPALLALLVTILLGGTLFFLSPNGLSAWLSALPAYLKGWAAPSSMTPARLLVAFAGYEALGIFLAVFSLIRGYRTGSRRITRLALWLGVALLLAIFYRQMSEFVWAILPLLTLAALELSRAMNIYADERLEVGIVVVALMILLVYIWFDVAKIGLDPYSQLNSTTLPLFGRTIQISSAPYIILLGASLILVLCIAFVAFGWSTRTAWLGTVWVFTIFMGVYTLASAWGASRMRAQNGLEFWLPDQPPVQSRLLLSTVYDVSEFSLGHIQAQPVTIMGIDSPALEWLLHDRDVEVVPALDPQVAPPIVITPVMEDLGLPSAYRGQDFAWRQTPLWQDIQNLDWISWLVFRKLPKEEETVILWARDDLFPDARETSQQP